MTAAVGTVHVVVPEGIDDPARPSGGNVYDRRLCTGLTALGWQVQEHPVPGTWPDPDPAAVHGLGATLGALPHGAVALVDGLVASAAPDAVRRYAGRLRLVVLVHLPLGVLSLSRRPAESALLARVAGVVTTSEWTRAWLEKFYGLTTDRVRVAVPGTDPAALATGTPAGGALLCVGAVTPTKGQDLLVRALSGLGALEWECTCVGSLEVQPGFVGQVRALADDAGLADRIRLTGPKTGADLDAAYDAADVLVLPSRAETYGMVVTEALARGLPAIATRTGGTPEALGRTADGRVPGLLVPADDTDAFAAAVRAWLEDPGLRERTRAAARDRRAALPTWPDTAAAVAAVLAGR